MTAAVWKDTYVSDATGGLTCRTSDYRQQAGIQAPPAVATSIVPCNGCRECCKGDTIVLHPECGDDPAKYKTVPIKHPLHGNDTIMLEHKENGDCIYLAEGGCTIYDDRPVICREYDCRKQYLMFTKAMRSLLVERGMCDKEKFAAGKSRLHTLTGEERLDCIAKRKLRETRT